MQFLRSSQAAIDEEMLLFGEHLPSVKRQAEEQEEAAAAKRVKSKNPQTRGQGKGKGKGNKSQRSRGSGFGGNGAQNGGLTQEGGLQQVLKSLTHLMLRHEDVLARLAMDTTHLWTFSNEQSPQNVLPIMWNVSQAWKKLRDESPEKLTRNLRTTVILALLQELQQRATRIQENKEARDIAVSRGWIKDDKWLFLRWSHESSALEEDSNATPVPLTVFATQIQRAMVLLKEPAVLHKYQSTRPLAEEMTGNTLCFMSEISLRGPSAQELWGLIDSWYGLAALNLIGLRIRPARAVRSKLAEVVQENLGGFLH